jgi:peptidoglycan/xylan/chitin deacetylase (PgdA/CDA1 family)
MKTPALLAAMALSLTAFSAQAEETPAPAPMHVALMIDDGPGQFTEGFLAVLKEKGIPATFDLIGTNVEKFPALAAKIAQAGHQICNHSFSHQSPKTLSDAQLEAEILGGAEVIRKATGQTPLLYWPPYLETDPRQVHLLRVHGMKLCQWQGIASGDDWIEQNGVAEIVENVVSRASDGHLILMHEFRKESLDALPILIEKLKAKGAIFLTYDQMQEYRASLFNGK